jgi:two-component system cell cycle sensor histidine kinase/response regulator CckA
MTEATSNERHRILVIDDNAAIHDDIRKILGVQVAQDSALTAAKTLLFGDKPEDSQRDDFEIDSAYQGEEGLLKVTEAAKERRPYALAFVDVRMPPGWDGVETITRIWKDHPDLQVVICTAYSDYSWEDMVRKIGRSSSMVVLKKPFDNIEVLQLAHALTEKWRLNRQVQHQLLTLDHLVDERTIELRSANEQLKKEITERLLVEKALLLSEERFSKAFKANPIPLAIQSLLRETITDANEGFQNLTGYNWAELVGQTPLQIGLWAEPEQSRHILEQLRTSPSIRQSPCQLRTRSGALRDILLSVELIELEGESFLLTIAQDITEQLQLEKQLRHSQKMDAVGQLAAGIAHDFNNMLTVIQGNASLVLLDDDVKPDRALMEGIVAAALRSARLVRQLLAFSYKKKLEVRTVNVSEIIASLSEMLPRMLGEQIAVRFDVRQNLPPIVADSGLIEQVLMNLAVNARDAMPHGGSLAISATEIEITSLALRTNNEARAGHFLRLSVSDTGWGIPPEVLPRIFEPFFTTKPFGKGTGLGLATVYGVVRQHEGWIEVQSEVGKGTTFHVLLPFATKAAPADSGRAIKETPRSRGSETILVVEDEEPVRRCVSAILGSHGYTVISACNGTEALASWDTFAGKFELLITDMVMPEQMTGVELARRLLERNPRLKVIYSSGYHQENEMNGSSAINGHRFLAKPYQSGQLLQVVRECLDQQ